MMGYIECYVECNVNNRVKVKLTEDGQAIVREHYAKILGYAAGVMADEEGYTSFQVYEFMKIFGNHMSLGRKLPFDACILIETARSERNES